VPARHQRCPRRRRQVYGAASDSGALSAGGSAGRSANRTIEVSPGPCMSSTSTSASMRTLGRRNCSSGRDRPRVPTVCVDLTHHETGVRTLDGRRDRPSGYRLASRASVYQWVGREGPASSGEERTGDMTRGAMQTLNVDKVGERAVERFGVGYRGAVRVAAGVIPESGASLRSPSYLPVSSSVPARHCGAPRSARAMVCVCAVSAGRDAHAQAAHNQFVVLSAPGKRSVPARRPYPPADAECEAARRPSRSRRARPSKL
jgi:hypothetical protein